MSESVARWHDRHGRRPPHKTTALYAFHRFAPEIKSLAARLRKGKVLGQEIELERSLDRLGRTAAKAESEVAATVSTRSLGMTPDPRAGDRSSEVVQRILTTAAQSPKAGLLLLASELEGELRHLLASFVRALSALPRDMDPVCAP